MDFKLAYLHGVLEEDIHMEQPEGFVAQGDEDKVCRLMCSLYRLKQADRVWNRTFAHTTKRKLGFDTIHSDAGVYILRHHHKRGDSETDMILILYVNDLLLLGEDLSSGCTEHVTPVQSDLHNYREYNPPGKAEITDGKFITIKGQGNIIGHSLLPDKTKFSLEIRRVLYVPDVSKQLFC